MGLQRVFIVIKKLRLALRGFSAQKRWDAALH
jgi:hypothetical protein